MRCVPVPVPVVNMMHARGLERQRLGAEADAARLCLSACRIHGRGCRLSFARTRRKWPHVIVARFLRRGATTQRA